MSGRRRNGMYWLPKSPDLSPADFWLHGCLKVAEVFAQYFTNLQPNAMPDTLEDLPQHAEEVTDDLNANNTSIVNME